MKKVLIVTYYWPPAGGPGVQRWLKFIKYLPEFEIEPIVYVPQNPHYPLKDESLLEEIPPGVKVIKKPVFEPYALAGLFSRKATKEISSGIIPREQKQGILQKIMLYIRGNFFIPDARRFWVKPSVRFLSDYILKHKIDTVITTGPPHSMHLIGLGLKEVPGIKWIADFRDPWTQIGYHNKLKLTRRSQSIHENLEKQVLQSADSIITTSFNTRDEFQGKTERPVKVITNGYDVEQVEKLPMDQKFSLSHIGSLLSGRNPEQLWRGLFELCEEDSGFAQDFELKLVGAVGEEVLESIKNCGLEKYIWRKDYVSHPQALQLQRSSQVLLLIEIDSEQTRGIIPGKLFEYMVSGRPVLAVGPEKSDVQTLLGKTNTGSYFLYSEKDKIKAHLLEQYKLFKKEELVTSPIGLKQYSRRELTGQLAQQIKGL